MTRRSINSQPPRGLKIILNDSQQTTGLEFNPGHTLTLFTILSPIITRVKI
jgi:hypothetical protein